jgi:DNA-binding transcriptional MerR regulator
MSDPELPDKLYFKIGEVAKLVGVKPYVLRYWETEFSVVRPGKTRSSHRLYRRRDVETLLEIRRLLYGERYTIEGAKRRR